MKGAEESGNAQAPVNDIQVEGEGSENVNAQAPVDTKDIHPLGVADKEDAAATDGSGLPAPLGAVCGIGKELRKSTSFSLGMPAPAISPMKVHTCCNTAVCCCCCASRCARI